MCLPGEYGPFLNTKDGGVRNFRETEPGAEAKGSIDSVP